MRRVRAPGRVNLIGDHTDYTGGLAFPMAIDRWTTIDYEPAPSSVDLTSADEPIPVSLPVTAGTNGSAGSDGSAVGVDGWGRYVAAVIAEIEPTDGIAGRVATTIPIGAGLSSSAALEVALALALGFDGSPLELAQLCRRAEHRATGVPTGIMDQLCIASAIAGSATLIDCHSLEVSAVPVPEEIEIVVRFVAHRTLEGSEYDARVEQCRRVEELIGPLRLATEDDVAAIDDPVLARRARHVVTENQRVRDFAAALAAGEYPAAGALMTDGHRSLADDYETSIPVMDDAVAALVASPGVFGARMTGGGFGGSVVALCRPGSGVDGWKVKPSAAAGHGTPSC